MSDTTKMMDSIESLPNFDMPKLTRRIIFAFVVAVATYLIWFNFVVDTELGGPGAWGQFGDYIGGLLNPALSAIALVILAASLSANVVALKQNQDILKLTSDELVLTRQQIEDTEKALKMQTDIVQRNAHVERLGVYAEKVFKELLEIRHKERSIKFAIGPPVGDGWAMVPVFTAFDTLDPRFSEMRKTDQWPGWWQTENLGTELLGVVNLMQELIEICTLASTTSGTKEMIHYYGFRLGRWLGGAVQLGYIARDLYSEFVQDFE